MLAGDSRLCVTPLLETLDDVNRFAFEASQPIIEVFDCQPKFRDLVPHSGEVTLPANLIHKSKRARNTLGGLSTPCARARRFAVDWRGGVGGF